MSFPVPGIGNTLLRSIAVNVPLVGAIVLGFGAIYIFLHKDDEEKAKTASRQEFLRRLAIDEKISIRSMLRYKDAPDPIAMAIDALRQACDSDDIELAAELAAVRRALQAVIT